MVDTENIGFYAVTGIALYFGYRMMVGTAETATAPFEYAAGLYSGVAGSVGNAFGGALSGADSVGGFVGNVANGVTGAVSDGGDFVGGITGGAGEIANESLAVPGDLINSGQNAFDSGLTGSSDSNIGGAIGNTVGNLNPF